MKALAVIGIGSIGLISGAYCQIEVIPNYNALFVSSDLSGLEQIMWHEYSDQKFLLGSIALLLGGIAAIVGIIAGLKKRKIGWIALVIGLISFFLGAAQSTHMFS